MLSPRRQSRFRPWPTASGRSEVVFVLGSGRSGTHWLGHILASHPDIRVTIEAQQTFDTVTRMALAPQERHVLMPALIERYRHERRRTTERFYADKSHPCLWIAEYLADAIPTSWFIAVSRNPYQAIASMVEHEGVNRWPAMWQEFDVPNKFLGISRQNVGSYASLTLTEQHALRWQSHEDRLRELSASLGPRFHHVQYSDLQQHMPRQLENLRAFLGLTTAFPEQEIDRTAPLKWRSTLNAEQVAAIERITGIKPPATPAL